MPAMTQPPNYERFLVFEGIDGAGTTTQLHRLAERLEGLGRSVHRTFEPSSRPVGALIRRFLRKELPAVPPDTLALLFAGDRVDHVESEVLPALARGEVVLSDRYLGSSLAYQGLRSDWAWLQTINRYAPPPGLVLYVRVDAETALARIQLRDGDRRELFEELEILRRVVAAYDGLYGAVPGPTQESAGASGWRACVIDGSLPPEAVEAAVWAAVERQLAA